VRFTNFMRKKSESGVHVTARNGFFGPAPAATERRAEIESAAQCKEPAIRLTQSGSIYIYLNQRAALDFRSRISTRKHMDHKSQVQAPSGINLIGDFAGAYRSSSARKNWRTFADQPAPQLAAYRAK